MSSFEKSSDRAFLADADNQLDENGAVEATHEVLLSADILPIILLHLRNTSSGVSRRSGLNADILPVLHISKAFFDAGASVLWEKIDGLEPLFSLLPWYDVLCESAQVPEGVDPTDWDRFNFYASHVRDFTLVCKEGEHPPLWVRVLGDLAVPGMPVPLFPKLRAAKISPVDFMSLKTFSLFISPSMRRLEVDLDRVSQEGGPLRLPPHLIIQATTAATQNLQLLHYTGPTDKAFFPHLVKLTSLTSLTLYLAGWQDAWELRCLRGLPFLEHVAILFLDSVGAASADNPMTGLRMHSHTSLTNLRSLDILAKQYQHCLVARSLSPRSLKKLILGFFAAIDVMPVHLALGLYLQANPNLEVLDVRFGEAALGVSPEVLPPESRVHWPTVHDASDVLSSALQASRSIREISLHHIPFHLAIPTSRVLCDAMPSIGASLVSLRMYVNVNPVPNFGEPASQGTAFPGLSFLASTVRLRCPNLKRLAFHFDANIVRHEDLGESLRHCEGRLQQIATSGHPSRDHQLSFLEVSSGTPTETSIQIGLSVDRKVKIASFLDRLFPHLKDVSGSGVWGPGTWLNINDLIKSFQDVRRTGSHRDVSDTTN